MAPACMKLLLVRKEFDDEKELSCCPSGTISQLTSGRQLFALRRRARFDFASASRNVISHHQLLIHTRKPALTEVIHDLSENKNGETQRL